MSNAIIIGIHGLSNKPRPEHLTEMWVRGISVPTFTRINSIG